MNPTANQSDAESAEFIRRLQDGDEDAYRELLERWRRPVLNFVFRMTGDAGAADEIAQQVFVRISQKIGGFKPTSDSTFENRKSAIENPAAAFAAWIFQIARNAALDALRHRARHPADALEEQPAAGGLIADSAPSPARAAELRDTGAEIAAAVLALPEDQRTALILAEYHDFAVAEIAAVMGTNVKSVEARLYRARQTLRQRLAHLLR